MPWVDELALIDHHCHSVTTAPLDADEFGVLLTGQAAPPGLDPFDSAVGLSVRRWCAPVLDLPAHAAPGDYLARRAELGADEATRWLLRAAGTATMLVDTGLGDGLLDLEDLGKAADTSIGQVLRLEAVAEQVADAVDSPSEYPEALAAAVTDRARPAVATKSILAYRYGFDVEPTRPSVAAVRGAAAQWLPRRPGARLADPVLLRHALWCGVDTGLPLQLHTGLGDPDEDLHRANPALLTQFCRNTAGTGTPVVLLHCYPYHREAAWLAQVFAHVHVDVGLASTYAGGRASELLAELVELAPFGKVLYSSDGVGLAELHLLGAIRFRRALREVLNGWHRADEVTGDDARRIAGMLAGANARRLYRLNGSAGAGG